MNRATEFLGGKDGALFVADFSVGDDKHGGRTFDAVLFDFCAEVFDGRHEFGAASHPDAVNGRSFGAEVDVSSADQFGLVVADRALEERKPDTGLGMQTRDKGSEGFAGAHPVVAPHAAAAIEQEVNIGRCGRFRGSGCLRQTDLEETATMFVEPRTHDGSGGRSFVPGEDEIAVG